MKDAITGEDWDDFWSPTLEEREQSIEDSLIHLSRRKLKLLEEVQEINIHIEQLRNQLK